MIAKSPSPNYVTTFSSFNTYNVDYAIFNLFIMVLHQKCMHIGVMIGYRKVSDSEILECECFISPFLSGYVTHSTLLVEFITSFI